MKNKFLFTIGLIGIVGFFGVKQAESAGGVCGNLSCEAGENSVNCAFDCNPCGDGNCDAGIGENSIICATDCSDPICGDGTCDSSENYTSCPLDCTTFPEPQPDPGEPSPSCKDVVVRAGEETLCSMKIKNVTAFPLAEVTAQVTIPDKVTKVDSTDSWNCMSTSSGVKCQKMYNPYLIMGEIEYLELTLTANADGKYPLAVTLTGGSGVQYEDVTYNTSEAITMTDSTPITATANEDYPNDDGGCIQTVAMDVAANDVLCSSGQTTFQFYNIDNNVTVNSTNTNTGEINLDLTSGHLFDYDILCNGVVTSSSSAVCFQN